MHVLKKKTIISQSGLSVIKDFQFVKFAYMLMVMRLFLYFCQYF